MRRALAHLLLPCVVSVLLVASALAQHEDARAAPGRWCTLGGSPSRSGASRGEPLRGLVAVAWTHDAGGTIEGEPLVWDDTVVLAVKLAENRRALRFLDLLSGEPLSRDWIANIDRPIEPSLWGDRVIVRKAPTTLTCVQLRAGRAYERWTRRFKADVGPPLIVGDAVYATVGGALERMTVGKNSSVWRVETRAVGRLSLRANRLLSLEHFRPGYHRLVERDAETGAETAGGPAYPTTGVASDQSSDRHQPVPVFLGAVRGLTIPHGWPAGTFEGSRCVTLEPDELRPGRDATQPALMRGYLSEPVLASAQQDEVLGVAPGSRGALLGMLPVRGEGESLVLATADICSDFLRPATPPTVVGDVALIGARAFDLVSRRVLWRAEPAEVETSRAIPARGSVLYVRGGTELVALKSALRGGSRAADAGASTARIALPEARLVMRDGTRREGSVFLEAAAQEFSLGEAGLASAEGAELERIPLDDVLVVVDSQGSAHWAPGPQALVRGLLRLADVERGEALTAIAEDARKLRDPDLAELAMEAALDAGSEDRALDGLPDWIEKTRSS